MRSLVIVNGGISQRNQERSLQETTTAEAQPTIEDKLQPTTNIAHLSIVDKANALSATSKNNTWIIDTGASDYMVRDTGHLQSLHSSTHSFISTANSSTSLIVGEGTAILTQTLTLNLILVVPNYFCS
jgi:hypothetical protein